MTTREEAAAKASYAFMENSTPEMFYADSEASRNAYLDDAKIMLAAADAHDAAHGIHRVSLDDAIPDEAMEAVEKVLDFHIPDRAHSSGCQLRCGYDGEDMSGHLAQHVLEAAAPLIRAQALEDAADELAAQRDATNHELTPEDGESVRDHNDGRFLGKTVAVRLLRARAATERGRHD